MGSVAKHVFLVTDPTKLESTVRTAFEIARTGRPGPVVIDIPKDVQNWRGVFRGTGRLPVPGYRQRMNRLGRAALSDSQCAAFWKILSVAKRPLIYAGGGVVNAGAVPGCATRVCRFEFKKSLCHNIDGFRRVLRYHARFIDGHARHARHGIR